MPIDPRYWSKAWARYRRAYLAEHTRCAKCGRLSQVVDHIQPSWKRPDLFFEETNHQALCIACNNEKGRTEDRR
jgi:5-methylcytosine-specific restriction endonuclease McrA